MMALMVWVGTFAPARAEVPMIDLYLEQTSTYGASTTLYAAVWGNGDVATGLVTFRDQTTNRDIVATGGDGYWTVTVSDLSAGPHTFVVIYHGDTNYAATTSSPQTITVAEANSYVYLYNLSATTRVGEPMALTVTIYPDYASTATGTVTFKEGITTLATAPVIGNQASASIDTLPYGNHDLTAVYSGDDNHLGSTSDVFYVYVDKWTTSLTLTPSATSLEQGKPLTLTATATPAGGGAGNGTPTGSITFNDGNTLLATVPMTNGTATHTTSSLALGQHSLSATYSADASYDAQTAYTNVRVTIPILPTTSTLSVSPTSAKVRQAVTLTGTVTSTGGNVPTGDVDFMDGATYLGTATLSGGSASLTTSSLSAGDHALKLVYPGDDTGATLGYAASNSSPVAITVSKGTTTSTLTTDTTPALLGSAVTLEAIVGAFGGGAPSGNVVFKDGGTTHGTVALDAVGIGKTIATGDTHSCVVDAAGAVKCWGGNARGQLGDSTTTNRTEPTSVLGLTGTQKTVAAGADFGCALSTTGTVACWGRNDVGQLGDGSTADRAVAAAVGGLGEEVTAIGTGGSHACALTKSGAVKCWGGNGLGQLGNNATTNASTPVSVTGLQTGVEGIAVGNSHACARLADGSAKCWGWNAYGQLGNGSTTDSKTPVAVTGLGTGVRTLGAGGYHNCAILTDDSLTCWGHNDQGQLGDGTNADSSTPTWPFVISSMANIRRFGLGSSHSCALATNGKVACWGANASGQLGDGTTTGRTSMVSSTTGAVNLSGGGSHTCIQSANGDVNCWGSNASGQLGNGTTTNAKSATRTSNLTSFVQARARLTTSTLTVGTHTISTDYAGDTYHDGGVSPAISQTIATSIVKTNTTTTISPSATSVDVGTTVSFTAAVQAATGSPTGTVTFRDGTAVLGTVDLDGGQATFSTASLTVGTHGISAVYAGNSQFNTSQSAATGVTVKKITTATSVSNAPASTVYGEAVVLSATVANAGSSVGTVTFYRAGSTAIGSAALSSGAAAIATTTLPVGTHAITAVFAGDTTHTGSTSSAVAQTVQAIATSTTASADVSAILPGGTVTFTATVAATSPTAPTPTGSVAFKTGATVLGTVALSSGTATLATRALTTGSHSVVATYVPATGFGASSATGIPVTVDPRIGTEFLVNTRTTGSQQTPTLAILKSGGFVATWASKDQDGSSWGVYAQRFLADGTPDGSEFRVNGTTAGSQSNPAVAATSDGGFTVAWLGTNPTGTSAGIWAQRYGATGAKAGAQVRVDTTKGKFQSAPTITAARPSGFAVAWVGSDVAGTSYKTYAQLYAQTGAKVGAERVVSKTVMKRMISSPSIAAITGGFVVVWPSAAAATGNPIIDGQRLTTAGALSGTEFAITSASFAQQDPVVAGTADGGFAVAWTSLKQDGSGAGVFAQLYKATGAKAGATFRANTAVAADQAEPAISARPGGGITIAWTSTNQDGSGKGVYAKRYAPTGAALDVEFRLNTTTAGDQFQPALAIANGNDFVATWTSVGQDGSLEGVYAQRFSVISP